MKWSMLCALVAITASGCGVSSAAPPKSPAPKASPDAKLIERFEANLAAANLETKESLTSIKSDTTAILELLAIPDDPQPVPQAPPVDLSPVLDRVQELADAVEELKPQPTPADQSAEVRNKVDAPKGAAPSLLFFNFSRGCPPCDKQKRELLPVLDEKGVGYQPVDETHGDLWQHFGVNLAPTWIRVDAAGVEVDRVPAKGAAGYSNAELERVLKIELPNPPAAPPKVAAPASRSQPTYSTPRQQRRAARGRG